MKKIVDFNKHINGRNNEMLTKLVDEIKENGQSGHVFSLDEVTDIARKILKESHYDNTTTPINKIAKDFGITPYKASLSEEDISGVIYVGGTTNSIYKCNKVIIVERDEPYKHQRFVIAHEIGHYLFDCLTDKKYNDENLLFKETYPKKNHDSPKEFRADRFAAELLMPTNVFIRQYNLAMEEKHNRMFTLMYLSEYFQTKISSIEKRIDEVLIG